MNMVQVYIKGQEDKELNSFFRYYPVRIKNIGMDAFFDRQVIFDFKDGRNHTEVAKCVAKMLVKKFGRKVRDVVFSCVPASSQERNEARNKNFSELVCRFSGAIDGFSHVKVIGERTIPQPSALAAALAVFPVSTTLSTIYGIRFVDRLFCL